MKLHRMTANFGCLRQDTLELTDGFNLIEAPNETGKSTWSAFLRAMLYGLPTRERGAMAEKNRYAPWDGSPMQGSLTLEVDNTPITLLRDSQKTPMGRFRAVYHGTTEPVSFLSGTDCGERLLGIPREVWERSAFIGQSVLPIEQSPELEKRIVALISTGEESISYMEAQETLKKQLTRRRHNKTGLLPAVEQEIAHLEEQLFQLRETQRQQQEASIRLQEAQNRKETASAWLFAHEQADAQESLLGVQRAEQHEKKAKLLVQTLRQRIKDSGLPEEQTLLLLQARLADAPLYEQKIQEAQATYQKVKEEEAKQKQQIPEQPQDTLPPLPSPISPYLPHLCIFSAIVLTLILYLSLRTPLSLCGLLPLLGLGGIARAKRLREAERQAILAQQERYEAEKQAYETAVALWKEAQGKTQLAQLNAENRRRNAQEWKEKLFEEINRFHQGVVTLTGAETALTEELSRYRQLALAEKTAQEATYHRQLLQSKLPELPTEAVQRPAISRMQAEAILTEAQQQEQEARRAYDMAEGRLHTIGEADGLTVALEEAQERRQNLQREYNALSLALETMEQANLQLQTRFSPALGKRTGEIFSALTGERWQKVHLNRSLEATLQTEGELLPHSAGYLSMGANDQLYLALRLAICELVLPETAQSPLILDDALVRFDDERMKQALDYLRELGKSRQILLFTCQHREAAYCSAFSDVNIQYLSREKR